MMDSKYIVVYVILHLTCSIIEAISIDNLFRRGSFLEYDILDIIHNSRKTNSAMSSKYPSTNGHSKELSGNSTVRFMKIHHGVRKNPAVEFTIHLISTPEFHSCNGTLVDQSEGNNTTPMPANYCTVISPNITASPANATITVD